MPQYLQVLLVSLKEKEILVETVWISLCLGLIPDWFHMSADTNSQLRGICVTWHKLYQVLFSRFWWKLSGSPCVWN